MKLTVQKESIADGLQKAAAIIPAKSGAAYLRSIWLKAENNTLAVMSTDANIEFTGVYPAEVENPGLLGVPGRAFVDLVRLLPAGPLELALDEKGAHLSIRQSRRSYRLPVSGPEWFQNFSQFPEEAPVVWSGDFLRDLLERISFCISDDDGMEAIACLYFKAGENGRIDACGLNGHQFAMLSFVHDQLCARMPEKGVLIQKKYLPDLKKWLGEDEIELNFTEKRIYLRRQDGQESLSLPRSHFPYPDYTVFLSRLEGASSVLTIDRREAMDALGRVLVFNTETDRCVFLDLSQDEVRLSAQGQEQGSASECLASGYSGDLDRIAFPTRNLQEIFGHFSSPGLELSFTGAEGPCGIRGGVEDKDYTVIIMPMKVGEKAFETDDD